MLNFSYILVRIFSEENIIVDISHSAYTSGSITLRRRRTFIMANK